MLDAELVQAAIKSPPPRGIYLYFQESDDEEVGEVVHAGGVGGGGPGAGAKGEGGHTAMVADILKEKEKAEERAKEADAEAKGRGDGQVWYLCQVCLVWRGFPTQRCRRPR